MTMLPVGDNIEHSPSTLNRGGPRTALVFYHQEGVENAILVERSKKIPEERMVVVVALL